MCDGGGLRCGGRALGPDGGGVENRSHSAVDAVLLCCCCCLALLLLMVPRFRIGMGRRGRRLCGQAVLPCRFSAAVTQSAGPREPAGRACRWACRPGPAAARHGRVRVVRRAAILIRVVIMAATLSLPSSCGCGHRALGCEAGLRPAGHSQPGPAWYIPYTDSETIIVVLGLLQVTALPYIRARVRVWRPSNVRRPWLDAS